MNIPLPAPASNPGNVGEQRLALANGEIRRQTFGDHRHRLSFTDQFAQYTEELFVPNISGQYRVAWPKRGADQRPLGRSHFRKIDLNVRDRWISRVGRSPR
jgi:hypothetical protein